MNKQEVIEKIEKEKSNLNAWEDLTRNRALDDALAIVRKLDELEKPTVPSYIDTWIQGAKYNGFDLYEAMTDDEMPDKVATWIVCNPETFAKAWIYGYEVEKEKLYTVELPNPNGDGYSKLYLSKNKDGKVELFQWSDYTSIDFADDWKLLKNAQLTEDEIKEDFDWAWQFKEEVEK